MEKRKQILDKLNRLCRHLKRQPTHREINTCSYTPTCGAYKWYFGSIENALKIIKCDNFSTKEECKKTVIEKEYLKLKKKLGFSPNCTDFKKESKIDMSVIYRLFGSWNIFLNKIGETPRKVIPIAFKNKKRKFIADDGHVCYSIKEMEVDNIINVLGLKHLNEEFYPYDEEYNVNERKRCDWKIGDTYVEYAGMLGHYDIVARKRYEEALYKKTLLCLKYNLNFLCITPDKNKNIEAGLIDWFMR